MMSPSSLADAIKEALGHKDKPTSKETKAFASAIIDEISQLGLVNFMPQTVSGTAPPGGPLSGGAASGGLIVGPTPAGLAARIAASAGFGAVSPQLLSMATGITTHIMQAGKVSFSSGKITGVCANSPVSPGPFTGAGQGGKITGLDGDAMASLMAIGLGGSATPELKKKAKAICDHIKDNAEVMFIMGSVTGLCSAGGGPLALGTAVGGRIS